MSLPVFFVESQLMTAGSTLQISGDEAHHALKSLRMQVGERLVVTDGSGKSAEAEVTGANVNLEIYVNTVRDEPRPSLAFTVVQALPKGDRGELAVELLTEVGVNAIVPWQATRSVSVWRDERKQSRGRQKWEATARSAAKQARRVWWPTVGPFANTAEVTTLLEESDLAVVLHEGGQHSLADLPVPQKGRVTLVVGPEGGLTDSELQRFQEAGSALCAAGPTVMRTSTAGAVGAAVLMSKSTRWSR